MFAICQRNAVHTEQGIGQMCRLIELEAKFAVQMCRRNQFQFGQCLHAALRLCGLGGLGLEPIDKRLQMLDFFLLLGVGRLLVGQPLCTLFQIKIIIAAVSIQLLLRQLNRVRGGGIKEIAVVRDDDLRARQ